jgi:hypothetical protein
VVFVTSISPTLSFVAFVSGTVGLELLVSLLGGLTKDEDDADADDDVDDVDADDDIGLEEGKNLPTLSDDDSGLLEGDELVDRGEGI